MPNFLDILYSPSILKKKKIGELKNKPLIKVYYFKNYYHLDFENIGGTE